MNISTNRKTWPIRVKSMTAALLFLTAYSISMIAPFTPVAQAQSIDAPSTLNALSSDSVESTDEGVEQKPDGTSEKNIPPDDNTSDQSTDTESELNGLPKVSNDLMMSNGYSQGCFGFSGQGCSPKGSIKIVKDAKPDSKKSFSFTTSGLGWPHPSTFTLEDNGYSSMNAKTFKELEADKTYTFSETGVGDNGWMLDSIVCKGGSKSIINTILPTVSITLKAGENITCTFINKTYGQIIVHKTTYPAGSPQEFTVNASSSNGGSVIGSAAATVSDSKDAVFKVELNKMYSVTETVPAGWMQYSNTCGNLWVGYGTHEEKGIPTVHCEIKNKKSASLTIVKQSVPDGNQTLFDFTAAYGQANETFKLSDGQSKTYGNLKPDEWVKVSESLGQNGDWKLTSIVCDNSKIIVDLNSKRVSFKPGFGETATCTFTNTRKSGTLTVIKNIIDEFGVTKEDVTDWTWDYTGPQWKKDTTTGSGNVQTVPTGTYTVSEDQKDGYHVVKSSCKVENDTVYDFSKHSFGGGYDWPSTSVKVTVGAGDNITCEFTNKRNTGTITVHKKVGDKPNPWGWKWWLGDGGNVQHMGDTEKVPTGWYWFGEKQQDGYSFENLKCKVNGHYMWWVKDDVTSKVYVGKDDHVVCTFTNSRDEGELTIVKDALPNTTQPFHFTVESVKNYEDDEPENEVSRTGSQDTNLEFVYPGSEDSELERPFYQPEKKKSWGWNWWGGNHDGFTTAFDLVDSSDEAPTRAKTLDLPTGWYRVVESPAEGWDQVDVSCGEADWKIDEDGKLYVYIDKHSNVSCTFTNEKRAELTIVKDAKPDSARSFIFTSTLPGELDEDAVFSLTDDGSGLTNSKAFKNLLPGTYTVTETAADSWKLDDIVCTGTGVTMKRDGLKLSVTLAVGAVASCTFVNSFVPQVLGDTSPQLLNTGTVSNLVTIVAVVLITASVLVLTRHRQQLQG